MKDIAIYGAGGYGREVACLIRMINEEVPQWNLKGFFDDGKPIGESTGYGPVLGGLTELNDWHGDLDVVMAIGNPVQLSDLVRKITNPSVSFPNIVMPGTVFLDKSSFVIGKGNIIGSSCRFSCHVKIGDFNIMNSSIVFGHDAQIGDCNVLGPETRISGGVEIGNCNFFGLRTAVLQYIRIGNNTRIGAGSFVMKHTKDGFLYMGNPAKKVEM